MEEFAPPVGEPRFDDPLALGAILTFDEEASLITVDVAEDETRDLVAVTLTEEYIPGSLGASSGDLYSVHFYLVDDASALPDSADTAQAQNPDIFTEEVIRRFALDDDSDYPPNYFSLKDYLDLAAEPIGSVDLGYREYDDDQNRQDAQVIYDFDMHVQLDSNQPIVGFDVSIGYDEFLNNQFLDPANSDTLLQFVGFGGEGNDRIRTNSDGGGQVFGGLGDDSLSSSGGSGVNLDGGEGNDTLNAFRTGDVVATGGEGNDTFSLSSWRNDTPRIEITDFDISEDILVFNTQADDGDVTILRDTAADTTTVTVNDPEDGRLLGTAILQGAPDIAPDAVVLT